MNSCAANAMASARSSAYASQIIDRAVADTIPGLLQMLEVGQVVQDLVGHRAPHSDPVGQAAGGIDEQQAGVAAGGIDQSGVAGPGGIGVTSRGGATTASVLPSARVNAAVCRVPDGIPHWATITARDSAACSRLRGIRVRSLGGSSVAAR